MLNVAGIVDDSCVDGLGIRMTIFVQGCSHHCKGCHNPETWNPSKRVSRMSYKTIINRYKKNPLLQGITISGGEPLEQNLVEILLLIDGIHKTGGDIWLYTGYTVDEIEATNSDFTMKVLKACDYVVDGPFLEEERDLTLNFRGSKNQRIFKSVNGKLIDVSKKIDEGLED